LNKLNHCAGFPDLLSYVNEKLSRYEEKDKTMETLFQMMFSEADNVMTEIMDGYRIQKTTYGQMRCQILKTASRVRSVLKEPEKDALVGIYMENSPSWLVMFWSVLLSGCRPLLMNTRLDTKVLEQVLQEHGVVAVISDGKQFSVPTYMARELQQYEGESTLGEMGTEVVFMSSGTSEQVKLCAYTGENFYWQLAASSEILSRSKAMSQGYEGELRQLALLPLYHVFGFIAVYLWFGFFARTFVFLNDRNPATILTTVRRHRVTHIFAVPLVWDTIYRETMRKVKGRGEKTYRSFQKALKLCGSTGKLGDCLANKLLSQVRQSMFGPSVRLMISGGSGIRPQVLQFFNSLGYNLVNGFGMTEVGITSVEHSACKNKRNLGSVGFPFYGMEYRVSPEGQLQIRTKARAARIYTGDAVLEADYDEWFDTRDMAAFRKGRYYIRGRADDLIVCENGENINPTLAEAGIQVPGCREVCMFKDPKDGPVLLAYAPDCYGNEELTALIRDLRQALQRENLAEAVRKTVVTSTPLQEANDFKISRAKVARRYAAGEFYLLTPDSMAEHRQRTLSQAESKIRTLFAQVLGKEAEEIGLQDDFFADLGGTSLDFYTLRELLKDSLDIALPDEEQLPTTVADCCNYFKEKKNDG